jgi:uracil-DNA glycosylase family 4
MKPPSRLSLEITDAGLKRDAGCKLCRLSSSCETPCTLGVGDVPATGMIIGESPGNDQAGKLLTTLLDEVGLSRDEVYITNAVRCRPPDNRTPTKREMASCSVWTNYEISQVKPKAILLLGGTPLKAVLGLTGIKKLRGTPIEKDGISYLPTLHPAYVLRDERFRGVLKTDLKKFKAMMRGGGRVSTPGLNVRIVRSRLDLEDMIDNVRQDYGMTFDLETSSLNAFTGYPVSLGVGTRDTQWIILINHSQEKSNPKFVERCVEELTNLNKPKCGHNVKFDSLWMKEYFGVDWFGDHDTMLAHYVLDENSLHGLDAVASEKYGALDWDVPLSLKHGLTGTVDQHCEYLALDVFYTYKLWMDQMDELDDELSVKRLFEKLIMPVSQMYTQIEYNGVYVDQEKFNKCEHKLRGDIAAAEIELNRHFPGVNWGSTQQVAKVLFDDLELTPLDKTAKGKPSTSESVLKRLAAHHPIPALLMKRRAAAQQLSFFIEGWKPYFVNGRLHPSFKIHGTVTGRPSCVDPNLQQIPRDPFIRQLITAPEGWELVEVDLSQIELRLAADMSGDPEMMRCFTEGIDIHWLTAMREIFRGDGYYEEILETIRRCTNQEVAEYDECYEIMLRIGPDRAAEYGPPKSDTFPGWKEVRKRAKAINFGYLYGMWWKKFIDYARDNYDVIVDDRQAQASRVSFFDLYRRLPDYHKKQRGFANRHGYVRSLFGRKRRLPHAQSWDDKMKRQEAERQAINSPIQSCASDLNLCSALELTRRHSSRYMRIVGTVHDSILIEVRKDKLRLVVADALRIMRKPAMLKEFDIVFKVPMEAEAKIGPWSLGIDPEKYYLREGL